MAVVFLDQIEFSKIPGLNFVLPVVTSDPSPTALDEGRMIYNTTSNEVKYCNETPAWVALGPAGAGGPPTGSASGDLTGSYPSPQIAAGVIVDNDINASAAIQTSKISGLDTALTNRALTTTDLTAGAGLTGGGTIAANRTFTVGAGTGITVNADDVAINRTTTDTWYLQLSGGTLTNFLTLHADPTSALHAATKQYVDLTAQGLTFKNAVRMVALTNQASLNGNLSIDGLTTAAGDRVLLAGQTSAVENGIWVASAGGWSRAADMDVSGELKDGTLVPVAAGTAGADSLYICTATGTTPWVPGTTTSTWTRFSSVTDLVAGAGLTKTGTTIDVVSATADLTVAADSLTVVSAPKWTTGRTITLTGDVTGTSGSFDGSGNLSFATTAVGGTKHYAGLVGSGTAVVINHALNTRDVNVEIYRNSTPWDTVEATVERTDVNNVTLRFATSVTASAYRVVITGK